MHEFIFCEEACRLVFEPRLFSDKYRKNFFIYKVAKEAEASARWGVLGGVRGAIRVGIARSALLSGYLGRSGHLPRLPLFYNFDFP